MVFKIIRFSVVVPTIAYLAHDGSHNYELMGELVKIAQEDLIDICSEICSYFFK